MIAKMLSSSSLSRALIQFNLVNQLPRTVAVCGVRNVHTSGPRNAENIMDKNFRKFSLPQKIGQYDIKHTPMALLETLYNYPLCIDTLRQRYPGYWFVKKQFRSKSKRVFVYVKEMEPELMVPDLSDFYLKPYVSYRAPEITQAALTPKEVYSKTYGPKVVEKFRKGEEVEVAVPQEDIERARVKAMQTGADLFVEGGFDFGISRSIRTDEQEEEEFQKMVKIWEKHGTVAHNNMDNDASANNDLTLNIYNPSWRD